MMTTDANGEGVIALLTSSRTNTSLTIIHKFIFLYNILLRNWSVNLDKEVLRDVELDNS
jgi:hypothetical protein